MRKVFFVPVVILVCFVLFFVLHLIIFSDKKLHIVFCDVGQGDAILIRTPSGIVSLLDGGSDESVLTCLSKHLPFWERTMSILLLSHPHADHYAGLIGVLDRFYVKQFATEDLANDTVLFRALQGRLEKDGILQRKLYKGDVFRFKDGVTIHVLGPSKSYLASTSPNGQIGERAEFASLVLLVTYHDFSVLLTGDSQVSGISDALRNSNVEKISVLQIPHHGSKTGLDEAILERLQPKLAVISVGKNSYGHPSPQMVELLRAKGIEVRETIKNGDVEIMTDGKGFSLSK